jgi:hypothetical protein
MSCDGGHLGFSIGIKNSNLVKDIPMIIPLQFKIVSISAVLYPRWPPLLKIEISSNGQNCSILSQKVPKFELYNHNDELFSSIAKNSNLVKDIPMIIPLQFGFSQFIRFREEDL